MDCLNKKIFLQKVKNNSKAYYCFQILLEIEILEQTCLLFTKKQVSTTVYYTQHTCMILWKKLNNKNLKHKQTILQFICSSFHNNLKSFEIKKVTNLIKYFCKLWLRKTYIISEIGINHNGEYNKVKTYLLVKESGADDNFNYLVQI